MKLNYLLILLFITSSLFGQSYWFGGMLRVPGGQTDGTVSAINIGGQSFGHNLTKLTNLTTGETYEPTDDEDTDIGFITIEESPRFKQSKKLSKREAKKDFELRMKKFIQNNLDNIITQGLDLHAGKHRIYFQFVIDKKGNITDIKVRAPHSKLKDEVTKMLQKLPQFIPGKHNGKVVKTKYNLPISFVVE